MMKSIKSTNILMLLLIICVPFTAFIFYKKHKSRSRNVIMLKDIKDKVLFI
jgi:hypothetical protein